MRFVPYIVMLIVLVACGKNDNFTSQQMAPNPGYQNPYPQNPTFPPTNVYPPGPGGYQPTFQIPPGYGQSFYYFAALYNYFAYRNQVAYWNQIWQSWQSYAMYSGYNQYNFGAFWNSYCYDYNVIDTQIYNYFDLNVYSYYGY